MSVPGLCRRLCAGDSAYQGGEIGLFGLEQQPDPALMDWKAIYLWADDV